MSMRTRWGFQQAGVRPGKGRVWLPLLACAAVLLVLSPARARAAATTAEQAEAAVKGWLRPDAHPLGAALGQGVTRVFTVKDPAGIALYHVVHLQPAGYVVVAADDRIEPVLAFSPQTALDPSPRNPLVDILARTLPALLKGAAQAGAPRSAAANAKWKKLWDLAARAPGQEQNLGGVTDPRVDPLTQSQWSQDTVSGNACYNYYTPPNAAGSASNYLCGCTATAMSQLMRFWQWPTAVIGTSSYTINVNGINQSRSLRGGDGAGGAYNWAQMALVPDSTTTLLQRQAIGALTADTSVRLMSQFTSSSTGAYPTDWTASFTTFGYANARCGYNLDNELGSGRNAMLNPNLDAGFPALLAIYGSAGGHAIVCDGYGYSGGLLYHHMNMGWAGAQDLWYNLPAVDDAYYGFTMTFACEYNVYPTGSGEIISGRVTDISGNPLAAATITAARTGGGTYTAATNSRGIYALSKVPSSSSYAVSVAKTGFTFTSQNTSTGASTDQTMTCGNTWGVNFQATNGDYVRVTSPNGGQSWTVGNQVTVTWTSRGAFTAVNFYLSADGGSTWTAVADSGGNLSTPNDGTETLTVPSLTGLPSTRCLFKIVNASDATVWDVSDANFVINPVGGWQVESVSWQVNYGNNWNKSGTVTKPGAIQVRLHFSTISVESGFDSLTSDAGDDWSGSYSDVTSAPFSSNAMNLTLSSDISVTGSFTIDRVEWLGTATGPATAAGPLFGGAAPPAPPASVAASDGTYGDRIRVTWTASAGASGYKVFRNTSTSSATAVLLGSPTGSPYDDLTAVFGTTYRYWVRATSGNGDSAFGTPDAGNVGYIWQTESVNWRVDYGSNWNTTGTVTKPGATRLRLHFSAISLETGYDHLRSDAGDDWSGSYSDALTHEKAGNAIALTVTSDSDVNGYFILDRVDWLGTATGPVVNGGALFPAAHSVKGDLNGDGKPDILLQNIVAGAFTVWLMNGSGGYSSPQTLTSGGSPVQLGSSSGGWLLVGCGDFNNDGKQDLLFHNPASGDVQVWFMNGLAVSSILPLRDANGNLLNLGADSGGWSIVACADFDGDGRPDVLLQNPAAGTLALWKLTGSTYTGSMSIHYTNGPQVTLGPDSGGWRVQGCGDFNGDGKADIVWQHPASGLVSVWFMSQNTYLGSAWVTDSSGARLSLGANSGGWCIAACADYTGDGKPDLLCQQNAQGALSLWRMNGSTYAGSLPVRSGVGLPLTLGTNSGGWTVGGCGDLNANGKAEIFWQNTALGSLSAWATSGFNYAGSMSILDSGGHAMGLGTDSGGWRAVGFADFNGDGKPDLLMQNDAQGVVCVWFLNGNKFVSGAMITTSSGQALSLGTNSGGWRVVGAADYNGDGKPDLILQNDAQGLLNIWTLNGTVFTGGYYITDSHNNIMSLGTNSSGWRAAGCSDFNGDGKNDIVMQNDALGLLTVWFLNGSKFLSSGILKDTSGNTMNLGTDSAGWRIRGCGDINGDGKKEVLWQHQATGYTSMWVLNGLTYLGGGMILDPNGTPVDLGPQSGGWRVLAPR